MTAGTAVIMWLGELITDRGVGNGMSVLIFTSIISSIPAQAVRLYQSTTACSRSSRSPCWRSSSSRSVVYVEQAQRRIPVQYAKRMIGRACTAARRPTSR
jgi:preprotein translocase subunit SecY